MVEERKRLEQEHRIQVENLQHRLSQEEEEYSFECSQDSSFFELKSKR